jgi:hypothetical protein
MIDKEASEMKEALVAWATTATRDVYSSYAQVCVLSRWREGHSEIYISDDTSILAYEKSRGG